MGFAEALAQTAALSGPLVLDRFSQDIPADWIEQALALHGKTSVRRRRLPAEQVVWLVLGAALFRNRSITDVVDHLELALPDLKDSVVAKSSVHEARKKLGPDPMQWLFWRTGAEWALPSAARHGYKGLSLFGLDGSVFRVPDSQENRAHFGSHSNGKESGSYPLCRLVALMALGSHLLADARFGPLSQGELTLAKDLWDRIPDDSLTLADRLFANPATFLPLVQGGSNRQMLFRAPERMRMKLVEVLGEGDELVEVEVDPEARKANPQLPERVVLRAIYYRKKGFPPGVLITTLRDAVAYPAQELVELYHQRWELELGYDELKTEMLERKEALRSQSPAGVEQELWGLLLAYNLVRLEMERVAEEAGVEPKQISFVHALHMIRDELRFYAIMRSPGALPRHLRNLRSTLKRLVLPPRRPERSYPREVKAQPRKYRKAKSEA